MKKWFITNGINLVLPMILEHITQERAARLVCDLLDKVDELVKESDNDIDDRIILPITAQVRALISN